MICQKDGFLIESVLLLCHQRQYQAAKTQRKEKIVMSWLQPIRASPDKFICQLLLVGSPNAGLPFYLKKI